MVAFYLGRLGDRRAGPDLMDVLQSRTEDSDLRIHVGFGLAELHDPDTFDALLPLLGDPLVGNAVSDAIEALLDPRTIDLLLPTLATDDELWRSKVAVIVGRLGEPALQPLLNLLTSDDARVREGAATGLGFVADMRTLETLADLAVRDPDSRVRAAAASSLGFIHDKRGIEPIVQALSDADVRVRLAAMNSLRHLALVERVPTDILPLVEQIASTDPGTIDGFHVVRHVAERVARDLRRTMTDGTGVQE